MADSNHSRRADYADFSENDPFAELTRIMGHDPREQAPGEPEPRAEAPQAAADDDFGIDLEQELMGEFDLSGFDEAREDTGAQPASDWRAPVEAAGEAPAFSASPVEVDHSVEDLAASIMDSFEADEAELHPADPAGDAAPATMLAVEMDEEPADEAYSQPESMAEASPVAHEDDQRPVAEYEAVAIGGTAGTDAAETEAMDGPADLASMASPAAYDEPQAPEAMADPVPETSLEDELSALLAVDGGVDPVEAGQGWSAADAGMAQQEQQWQPAVNTFGRANFAAPRTEPRQFEPAGDEPAAMEAAGLGPVSFAETPDWDEPEDMPAEMGAGEAGFAVSGASTMAEAAEEDAFTSIFSQALALDETDAGGNRTADYDEVLSHFSITAAPEEPVAPQPSDPAGAAGPSRPDAPAIDTVDVAEAAYAMSDDLDIPEIDYEAPAPQADPYDDLADDFARAFDGEAEPLADTSERPVAAGAGWDPAMPYAQAAAAAGQAPDPASAYGIGEGEWQADDVGLDDDFAFDDDLDQALANSVIADEAAGEGTRNRRGLIVAAAVAGVAVFGGLGILGMSLFGGGSDTPAVVRADTDPMKVRPENPGGTVVPNQDSEAYNRVSGGSDTGAPEQERLITTAEEPVDIAAETAPAALAPGVSEGGGQMAPAGTDPAETGSAAAQPKSEDRIEPAAQEPDGTGASGDLLAVAPRKVRTMVVRPDGTMVPREMPTPEEETVVAAAPLATQSLGQGAIPTIDQAAPLAGEDAGPNVDTPATVSVVPSQRREPQAAPAAPRPATQTPPATPVSAPAAAATAATSEWSMQIASQPTAESAQSTYQDLARRYGSILEGRGVSIVKADIAGKGTYYRVRIPSASRDEAINLCTRYKSAGGSCFVSR